MLINDDNLNHFARMAMAVVKVYMDVSQIPPLTAQRTKVRGSTPPKRVKPR